MRLRQKHRLPSQFMIEIGAGLIEDLNDLEVSARAGIGVGASQQSLQEIIEAFGLALRDSCVVALLPGDARLPGGRNQPAQQSQQDERGGSDSGFVSPNEFARAVSHGILARDDRQSFRITPN